MKSFRAFMKEETVPFANIRNGSLDIRDTAVQDNLNSLLSGVTSEKFVTPYIAYQRVSKVLASYHIFIPSNTFLEGDSGHLVHTVNQYGPKFGQMSDGSFVVNGEVRKDYTHGPHEGGENNEIEEKPTITDYFLYFEYRMSDCGMFKIFCEVVDRADLEEIMNDLEAEFDEEVVEDDLNEESVDFSQVTRDVKTGKLSTKNPKIDLSKVKMDKVTGSLSMRESSHKNMDEACWDTHKQVGMKKKGNRMVPNCVPKD